MAYSRDFRRKVLAVRNKEGLTIAEAAARFDVGSASVVRWSKNVERKPQGYRRRKIDLEALRKDVLDYPDAYQHERAQRFGVAQNAIFVALKKLQLTYKKRFVTPRRTKTNGVSSEIKLRRMVHSTGRLCPLTRAASRMTCRDGTAMRVQGSDVPAYTTGTHAGVPP